MTQKPFAESSEENKEPILAVLEEVLALPGRVLEIGSGTGQHAVWFPRFLTHIEWLPSDRSENLPGIRAWVDEAGMSNVLSPVELDVEQNVWPVKRVDYVFSANTVHIMSWLMVEAMFAGIGRVLKPGGDFCLYGPFSYGGEHTAPSNLQFDGWLKQRDPESGVRDVKDLICLAEAAGMTMVEDFPMPVNNRILHWRKTGDSGLV